ncbi:hypothetical protein C8J56DRAFT_837096 [Mycena floridula]|nr:hypothetical protein C8J56DRAFT_837096 [Mycena floridula]
MGKLNIAHHKSYHPYRRDNIEKVRRDEEEAKLQEAKEDGRLMLADSEARIDRLREKAGSNKKRPKEDDMKALEAAQARASSISDSGHINLFADLEQNAIAASVQSLKQSSGTAETEKGFPLAPSEKDRNPWYTSKGKQVDEAKMKRDMTRKSSYHDPLVSITQLLASASSKPSPPAFRPRRPPPVSSSQPPEVSARLGREFSERQRALELIRRKKQEMRGSETPSTVHGGPDMTTDRYNPQFFEETHRGRDHGRRDRSDYRDRRW